MEARLTPIGQAVARYLTDHWQTSCELADISQIPGGASRETYRISIKTGDNLRGLILRRDPPSSLIDTERQLEFNTYQAVYRAGVVPVPEPIVLEEANPGELLRPFSIMAQISQGQATPAGLDEPAMQPHKAKLGQQMWGLLGNLASTPIATLNLTSFMQVPDHPAQHELNYWTEVIRQDALHPQPVAEATIRWLQRHLPEPSGQLCLVHGDYRTGNYLYTPQGDITARFPRHEPDYGYPGLGDGPHRRSVGGLGLVIRSVVVSPARNCRSPVTQTTSGKHLAADQLAADRLRSIQMVAGVRLSESTGHLDFV